MLDPETEVEVLVMAYHSYVQVRAHGGRWLIPCDSQKPMVQKRGFSTVESIPPKWPSKSRERVGKHGKPGNFLVQVLETQMFGGLWRCLGNSVDTPSILFCELKKITSGWMEDFESAVDSAPI